MPPHVFIIDNYDSFTYNLVQAFGTLGARVSVAYHDQIELAALAALAPSHLCLSPGPGWPASSGVCLEVLRQMPEHWPVLGVCLGHQVMVEVAGGKVIHAPQILHGKPSDIFHQGAFPFQQLPNPFSAIRYHSLIADPSSLPETLEVLATSPQGEIMAIRHRVYPWIGVQFHPESVATFAGPLLLAAFLAWNPPCSLKRNDLA